MSAKVRAYKGQIYSARAYRCAIVNRLSSGDKAACGERGGGRVQLSRKPSVRINVGIQA
ncbi:unnamed protein product, partial [Iphiclides podalirius]